VDIRRAGAQFVSERELQTVEHAVARILAETERPVEVYAAVLEAIASLLAWQVGAVWELGLDARLRCVCTWHAGAGAPEFEALSRRLVLQRGEGLPGRVVVTGEPVWMTDAPERPNFPRGGAALRAGLHAAFAFPLESTRGVMGSIEFFASEPRELDRELLQTMRVLGSQIGQYVARRRAEEEVRATASRLSAMLDAALDAVITMDSGGRIVGWNDAAERIFGYSADEAVGADMAVLIVPPALRERHRRGLARYVETEQPTALDRRLELTGLRKDGSEFPIELAITRIDVPGPATFTGYVRDITDRRRAEDELRASRARLVEVADAERRRIQRNLHDGAQQRLTAVLLTLGRVRDAPEKRELLTQAIEELAVGLEELRALAAGLHPTVLSDRGLAAALDALALRAPIHVELRVALAGRLPEQIEATAYYVVAEALANVQKHARAGGATVWVTHDDSRLRVEVIDGGIGGADADGSGIRGLRDRVEAIGGTLLVESAAGSGTGIRCAIPIR
jgi:PAS domain S-box-containing protein